MTAPIVPMTIQRGKTLRWVFFYAEQKLVYKTITAMPIKAPCTLTVPSHGLPDGWPFRIECVKAPEELNSPDLDSEEPYYFATVVDADTVEINTLNAHCLKPFTGEGVLVYNQPADLTGYEARAQVRASESATSALFTWNSDGAVVPPPDELAIVDVALSQIILPMDPATSADLSWSAGVYETEAIAPSGDVFPVNAISSVVVTGEVVK